MVVDTSGLGLGLVWWFAFIVGFGCLSSSSCACVVW